MGLVSVSAFIVTFYNVKLYPDVVLHIIYFFMGIYGWAKWGMGSINWREPKQKLSATRVDTREVIAWSAATPFLVASVGYFFSTYTQSELPYFDSTIAVLSLIANWYLCRKVLENWLIWMTVDVIAISLYTYKGLYLTAGLYIVYLILCVIGYKSWKKELQA